MGRDTLLEVRLDTAEAERIMGRLAQKLAARGKLEKIIARAQNDALATAKAEAKRAIREEYNVPAGEINKTMSVKKSHPSDLRAILRLRGRMSVELIHYGAKDPNAARNRKGKGVTVKVLQSSKRAAIRPGGEHKIMATKKGASATWIAKGHVLARIEDAERPIQVLWGPSFLSRLSNADVRARLESKTRVRFENRLQYYAGQTLKK